MFDTLNGVPLHPLVVHGVVVLLPLATLGSIAIAVRPSWRRAYGALVVAAAAVATALVVVAISAGESLEEKLNIDVGRHEDLGKQLFWFALALLVLVTALVVLDRRERAADAPATYGSAGLKVVALLTVLAALAATAQVVAVGDSGARRVWCTLGIYDCDAE